MAHHRESRATRSNVVSDHPPSRSWGKTPAGQARELLGSFDRVTAPQASVTDMNNHQEQNLRRIERSGKQRDESLPAGLGAKASAYIRGDILTTRVMIIAARESELREALADADLKIQSIQIGTPTADSLRVYLADGIRTVIDVIIVVDEIEATPPAAMPLAA